MKLIIDIPEEKYDWIMNHLTLDRNFRECNITPLPKGHGRIIDYGYVVDAIDDWINAGEYNYTNATDYLRNRIRNVPTIIKADKENKE